MLGGVPAGKKKTIKKNLTKKKNFLKKKSVLKSSETYAQKIFFKSEKKIYDQIIVKNWFLLQTFFFVLKSSETYAIKVLSSALFEGGGSADR